MGDATRIDQILTNLLTNAIKYTPDEGTIAITAEQDAARLRLRIADSGIGIAETDQEQLFTRFYRSEDPAVRQISGTGLGLAITRSLVDLHGGEISMESQLDVGSTFTVSLPRATVEPPDWDAGLGQSHHILIVLEDAAVAEEAGRVFQSYGHVVHMATSEAEGLRLAEEVTPNLILIGDQLPDADGLSLVRRLRTAPYLDDPAIVLLSYARAEPEPDTTGVPGRADNGADDSVAAGMASPLPPAVDQRVFHVLALDGAFTMLLGGDHVRSRALIATLVRRAGHKVIETPGGVPAVEALLGFGNKIDIALVNSNMSDEDQFELMRSLRTNPRTQDVAIIGLITEADTYHSTQILVESLSAVFLNQHLSSTELVALIDQAAPATNPT
jgi:CheY-like chemotaxis protein/anti-sigma regulatory factor (Ser/Thr protein kinase)